MKEMMDRKKVIAVHIAVFWVLLGFLWLLLVCAAAIPNGALKKQMEKSALSYKEKEAFSFERGEKWNGISDNYADAILLNVSWNMGRGKAWGIRRAVSGGHGRCGAGYGLYKVLARVGCLCPSLSSCYGCKRDKNSGIFGGNGSGGSDCCHAVCQETL